MAVNGPDQALEEAEELLDKLKNQAKPLETALEGVSAQIQQSVRKYNALGDEKRKLDTQSKELNQKLETQRRQLEAAEKSNTAMPPANETQAAVEGLKQEHANLKAAFEQNNKAHEKVYAKVGKLTNQELALKEELEPISKAVASQADLVAKMKESQVLRKESTQLNNLNQKSPAQADRASNLPNEIKSNEQAIQKNKTEADALQSKLSPPPPEGLMDKVSKRAKAIGEQLMANRDPNSPLEHKGYLVNEQARLKYGMKSSGRELDQLIAEMLENMAKTLVVLPQRIYAFYAAKNQPNIEMERDKNASPASTPTPKPEPSVSAQRADQENRQNQQNAAVVNARLREKEQQQQQQQNSTRNAALNVSVGASAPQLVSNTSPPRPNPAGQSAVNPAPAAAAGSMTALGSALNTLARETQATNQAAQQPPDNAPQTVSIRFAPMQQAKTEQQKTQQEAEKANKAKPDKPPKPEEGAKIQKKPKPM